MARELPHPSWHTAKQKPQKWWQRETIGPDDTDFGTI
jgi:hypothetical protein